MGGSSSNSGDRCCDTLSADVSECESSTSCSAGFLYNNNNNNNNKGGGSCSMTSSPHGGGFRTVSVTDSIFPSAVFGGKDDVMVWEKKKVRKNDALDVDDLSG